MRRKRYAAVWAFALVVVMLLSCLFIVLEADHDCCGAHCAVCAHISVCLDLLRSSAVALTVFTAAVLWLQKISPLAGRVFRACCSISLITLKIKLSE